MSKSNQQAWKILVVDDEVGLHDVTRLVLRRMKFNDLPVELLSAFSAKEAEDIIKANPSIAVAIVDVVMENDQAGLNLVKIIRDKFNLKKVRIILRTGNPGLAPQREVIQHFEIDDYRDKTELTSDRLFTSVYTALRAFNTLKIVEETSQGLEQIIRSSTTMLAETKNNSDVFVQLLTNLQEITVIAESPLQFNHVMGLDYTLAQATITMGQGIYADLVGTALENIPDLELCELLLRHTNTPAIHMSDKGILLDIYSPEQHSFALWIASEGVLKDHVAYLIQILLERFNANLVQINLQREILEAQRASNRTKSKFLATMSHEIRTPLNGILGMAQHLLHKNIHVDEDNKAIKTIIESGKNLLVLLNDILDISKIEAGKIEIIPTPSLLRDVLQENINLFSESALAKKIHLYWTSDIPPNTYYLLDAIRIKQILSNLISNALKFTEYGSVSVVVSHITMPDHTVVLEFIVSDTGIGISLEDQNSLFKYFSQISDGHVYAEGGSGLGLSIVANLVNLMQGEYGVKSEKNNGAIFWFRIPTAEVSAPPKELSTSFTNEYMPSQALQISSGRILIAEDNPTNALVLTTLIKNLAPNIDCLIVTNGSLAVEAFKQQPDFFAIFMDIQMPVMGGIEATRLINSYSRSLHLRNIAMIAVTAFVENDDHAIYLQEGMDFLAKPIDNFKLHEILLRCLQRTSDQGLPTHLPFDVLAEPYIAPLVFNHQGMIQYLGGDVVLAQVMIQSAMMEAPKYFNQMYDAFDHGNWLEVKNLTHTLKGLIAQIGGDYLAHKIGQIDRTLRNGETVSAEILGELKSDYAYLLEEIKQQGFLSVAPDV